MEEEPTGADIVPASVPPEPAPPRGSPVLIFVGIAALALASLGGPALVFGGATRLGSVAETTEAPLLSGAPARTAAATPATAAAGRVRVLSTSGRSRPIAAGRQHEVTFVWVLQGARENDPVAVHFYAGTRSLGQQTGSLDPSVFVFTTGTLTLTAQLDCSAGGWSAEILTIRDVVVDGDTEARVPGATCP